MRARFKKIGVNRALVRAGVRIGDIVTIGDFSFEYEEE
jgi:Obg family GTPase CgtA-like protein